MLKTVCCYSKRARTNETKVLLVIPILSFIQVTGDLAGARAPAGHGHRYGTLPGDAWAKVASPPGWTAAKTARLKTILEAQEN